MKQSLAIIILSVAIFLTCLPLFNSKLFFIHDYVHAARVAEMYRGWQDGQIPVRWSQNFGYGYGMPLFEFYAPLPSMVGALLYWLKIPLVGVVRLQFVIPTIFLAIGGYLLGKRISGVLGGIVLGVVFVLAPYRALNLYVRGAVSEIWALSSYPWLVLCIWDWFNGQKKYGQLILTATWLALSHNLSILMFLPVAGVMAVWSQISALLNKHRFDFKNWGGLLLAGAITFGLIAFYLLPAFIEKDLTRVNELTTGYFSYHQHFVYLRQLTQPYWGFGGSQWGPDDGLSFFVSYVGLAVLGLGLISGLKIVITGLMLLRLKPKLLKSAIKDWWQLNHWTVLGGLLLGLGVFMSSGHSIVLWQKISVLPFIQFPWRWLGVSTLGMAMLAASLLNHVKVVWQKLLLTIVICVISLLNVPYFWPEKMLANDDAFYYGDEQKIASQMSEILPDYIPDTLALPIATASGVVNTPLDKVSLIEKNSWQTLVGTNFQQSEKLVFNIANYPGWMVEIDGQKVLSQVSDAGLLMVDVPAGEHKVGAFFGQTPIRASADAISLISWVGLITYYGWYYNKKKHE